MRFDDLPRPMRSIVRFMLHDEVRIFEMFSAVNLIAWAVLLWERPAIFDRPDYAGFDTAPASVWAMVAWVAGVLQFAAMIMRHAHIARLRFPAMAIAAGVWTVIAYHFWSGPLSTASVNYTLIAVGCAVSGIYLGWKPTSNNC